MCLYFLYCYLINFIHEYANFVRGYVHFVHGCTDFVCSLCVTFAHDKVIYFKSVYLGVYKIWPLKILFSLIWII